MEKKLPKIIREEEGTPKEVPGGGHARRMFPAESSKIGMGMGIVDPGKAAHGWHTHDKMDRSGNYVIHYPKGFEEEYIIIQGEGVLQWKEGGRVHEEKVKTWDAVYFPPGVVEHQVLNNSDKPLIIVYAVSPLPKSEK